MHLRTLASQEWGDGTSETLCPRTNFLGTLVPKMNRRGNTISLHLYIPVILLQPKRIVKCKMTGMYLSRDIYPCHKGRLIWGPGVPEHMYWGVGHIVSGHTVTPPMKLITKGDSLTVLAFPVFSRILIPHKQFDCLCDW